MTKKLITRVIFRPRPNIKNYIYKYDDSSIVMETLLLSDVVIEHTLDKLIYSKLNKHLYLRLANTSFDTIAVLNDIITNDKLKGLAVITIDTK